jgi:tetratricopeptide (TPR) repeat protein
MMSVPQALAVARQNLQAGKWQQAEYLYQQILDVDPYRADALFFLGVIAFQTGRMQQAVDFLQTAVRARPDFAEACNYLGMALEGQGRVAEAMAAYERALGIRPEFPEVHNNLAIVLRKQGRLAEAVDHLKHTLRHMPTSADVNYNLGNILRDQGQLAEAVVYLQQAVRLRPDFAEAHNNLGIALEEQGKLAEAAASFEHALRLRPDFAEAHNNLGNCLRQLGRLDEAAASLEWALRLTPDDALAHNNLGSVLEEQDRLAEAAACFETALRLKPDYADAHYNLSIVLQHQGRFAETMAHLEQALQARPDFAEAHYNRSMLRLLLGDYERGWPEYEWRWRTRQFPPFPRTEPLWDGKPLEGKTILLHAEQGLGDTLLFIRYAAVVKAHGGTVVAACPPELLGVLTGCPGIDQLLPLGEPLPACAVQAPLLSLPGLCGTTLSTIPTQVPYLHADREREDKWRRFLDASSELKVGICWQGSPRHRNDRRRSVALAQFAPVAELPGVRLVSLQRGPGQEQWGKWASKWPVLELPDVPQEPSQAWVDTAALMCALDLVITVDTAVAHLAGALGVPVWLAVPFSPDWRWLLEREGSPWYPTMRLFRQSRPGDWMEVLARIATELHSAKADSLARKPAN